MTFEESQEMVRDLALVCKKYGVRLYGHEGGQVSAVLLKPGEKILASGSYCPDLKFGRVVDGLLFYGVAHPSLSSFDPDEREEE